MKALFTIHRVLTDQIVWAASLSIFILLIPLAPVLADDNALMTPMPVMENRPDNSALGNADRNYRLGLLLHYIRHEGPTLIPGLPDALHEPADFIIHQLKSAEDGLGLGGDDMETGGVVSSFFAPMFSLIRPPEENDVESFWLTPSYRHMHGMMPFDDAVIFGFNYRNTGLFDDRVRFKIHPYYAQNWHSTESYWGTEVALGFGPSAGRSWGTIVMRYDNGSSDLMGHGRGFDMHADFAFDEHLSLTAGEQQNEEGDLGNYVLLRWRLVGFGAP